MNLGRKHVGLEALTEQIRRIERSSARKSNQTLHLSFGIEAIDHLLLGRGLCGGALHEVLGQGADSEHAALPSLLVASLLGRHGHGQVLWAMRGRDLFAPALSAVGLRPERLILVEAGSAVPEVMEQALRHPGLLGVVGEIDGKLALTASRRLQLAAETSGAIGFAIRRSRHFDDPMLLAPSAAITRWRIGVLPTPGLTPDNDKPMQTQRPERMLGPALWRLELLRSRLAGAHLPPTDWILEACDETHRLSLAAPLADRPAVPSRRTA